jgi:predicted lactoylglutathione lyase
MCLNPLPQQNQVAIFLPLESILIVFLYYLTFSTRKTKSIGEGNEDNEKLISHH